MQLYVMISIEVPDPTPTPIPENGTVVADATPSQIAPDASKPPEDDLDLTRIAGAVDKTLEGLPAQFAEVGLGLLNSKVQAVIADESKKPQTDAWNTAAPIYAALMCKQIPGLPGLVMIPTFTEDADMAKAQVFSMKGGQNQKDGLAYRMDVMRAITHGAHIIMRTTEQAFRPVIAIAKQVIEAQAASKAAQAQAQAAAPTQEASGEPKTA